MNFEDINLEQSYTPIKAYCQSKLANVLFSKELAKRLQGMCLVILSMSSFSRLNNALNFSKHVSRKV